MLTTVLILSLLALTGTDAACNCYFTNGATVNGPKISVSNAFESNDYSTCYVDGGCGFVAYSGSATVGWTSITITFSTKDDPTGKFVIYDGQNASVAVSATYSVSDSGTTKAITSSSPYIYVLYTQNDKTKPNAYYGNLVAASSFASPATPSPPPTTQPSSNYNTSLYAFDPYLISHDTLIMVNQRTTLGAAGLTALNSIAQQFVSLLSVTTSTTGESQTRLGLATVTPYPPNYAAQGQIWAMSADDVTNSLPKAGVSIDVDIIKALNDAVSVFFNVSSSAVAPTRKNVQRSIVLLTAWWDDSQKLDDSAQQIFDSYGVNLAVIAYNTTSSLDPTKWYNLASLTTTTTQDVANIVNRFFFNSAFGGNTLTNNWCKRGADPTTAPTLGGSFQEPWNYGGPPTNSLTNWGSTDGQMKRYCNFQDSTYTYNRQDATKNVTFTVNYELEVDQDFLKFYADGVEVESFTGMDVNNAYFEVNATQVTARFTTNNAGVRRGFYVKVEEKTTST